MTHFKRQYERVDFWSTIKINNVIPLITFLVGLMSTIYVFQAKIDRTIDRVTELESQFQDYRTIEYKNAIQISALNVRLGLPDDPQVKGVATSSGTLLVSPEGP